MAEHLRNELARAGEPIRPSRVLTLAHFIAARSKKPAPPRVLVHVLIRQALAELQPERFRALAEYEGLHSAIADLMEELPVAIAPPDLSKIFRYVEREIAARGFASRNERLNSADLDHLPERLFFDGFFSFSPVELDLIERISVRANVIVTLPDGPGAESARARFLAAGFQEKKTPETRRRSAIAGFHAATVDREVEEIARRVLDEVHRGRAFREIGIILRAQDPYRAALETALARFGIPARFHFFDSIAEHPAIACVSRLVHALLEDWDQAALLSALRMPASGIGATPEGDAFDFALRAKLPGRGIPAEGPEMLKTLAALTSLGENSAQNRSLWSRLNVEVCEIRDISEPRPKEAVQRCLFTQTLIWNRERNEPQAWAARIKTLRKIFPLAHGAAFDAFEGILDETASILSGRMPLADFWRDVELALSLERFRLPDRRRNVVHVMDVFEARQWELPIVFVCGMMERHFPQYHRENPLFGDALRRRAGLKTSSDLQAEEKFLFEIATTRATEATILSYARFDHSGEEHLPSFFLAGHGMTACERRIRPRASRTISKRPPAPIRSDSALSRLSEIHRRIAATAIETFLQCPFQFFASRTLKLNPRPPEPRDRLDVRLQGIILHEALAEHLRAPLLGSAILDQVFLDQCQNANVPMTYRTEAVRLEILRNFEAFIQDRQFALGWESRAEEKFAFALTPVVSITGRIDRLDISLRNEALVIDYKYSAAGKIRERVNDNDRGTLVQGGLYLAAAERALGFKPAGMLYCGLRKDVAWDGWHIGIPGLERIGESRTPQGMRELIEAAIDTASRALDAIASGEIAARPADEKKCVWCDFRDMCRVESAPSIRTAGVASF